jgi:hypothetical protein
MNVRSVIVMGRSYGFWLSDRRSMCHARHRHHRQKKDAMLLVVVAASVNCALA